MVDPMADSQLELFPRPRPLLERFGAEFFRAIPRRAGVYVMTGENGRVLYIGKASDLRERLCSYKYVRATGKTWRLACRARAITWELCDDPSAASLRENELLRLHKPVFNVVNTHSEHYPFIGLRCVEGTIELRITKSPQLRRGERLFGAFKGLPLVRTAFAALMRLMWAVDHQITSPFEFPSALLGDGLEHWTTGHASIMTQLEDFLSGRADELIDTTIQRLPKQISRFQQALHDHDAEIAREFFLRGPKRNAELRTAFELRDALVAQHELDDLLALRGVKAVAQPVLVG
jgi:predicted GIY-YIG superfamily endonuclease